jgi:xanthine dehydrogenase small subunit
VVNRLLHFILIRFLHLPIYTNFKRTKKNFLIHFILNEKTIATDLPAGMVLLDFIRYHQHLTGTKIGCREGDCGACTVLIGELKDNQLKYTSATSCLMPLGNAHLKHIVTIEGTNLENELNPIQQAMADEGATQCGFCTPGFVVSLSGFCLSDKDPQHIGAFIDGNICRCTGYKSIQRAAERIGKILQEKKKTDPVRFATDKKILPSYFNSIKEKLLSLQSKTNGTLKNREAMFFVGGGTDLYVQKHDEMKDAGIHFMFDQKELKGITEEGNKIVVGPSATVTDLKESPVFQKYFEDFETYIKLVSSTPIRNMATIAGNFVNASPIGDFTIFFLALDAQIVLNDGNTRREIPLRNFYKAYKKLDKKEEEFIEKVWFAIPAKTSRFSFEKVSKRTNLDIASINSAILLDIENDTIKKAGISAGGVGPVPMYLAKASEFAKGKKISAAFVHMLIDVVQEEISPITDARGTAAYKRLLLGQLIKAHFIKMFPDLAIEKILFSGNTE